MKFLFTLLLVLCSHELPAVASKNSPIQTFVVPHSHMDVGWVYTVDESMHAYAANVYTSVTEELSKVKGRKFIAVEQEFFRLWWDNVATESHKEQARRLVEDGRLEFVLGGQVMHDEAVTDLEDEILQLTEGHGFLYQTFGVRPQFSWHVDPFGASASTPVLFALAGFNAHLISRIDYDLKDSMQKNKELQFVWRGSRSLREKQQIFTHTMDQFSYCTPSFLPFSNSSGFYWNGVALFPDPPEDGVYPNMSLPVTGETVHAYAKTMVENIRRRAAWFRTRHVLWPWGCDKQFFNSSVQFSNMDRLMSYINQHSQDLGLSVQYATLSEYFQAVHQSHLVWDVRGSEDFLPYSSEPFQAWTGFYASRNVLKGAARRASARLHAAETLFARYRIAFPDGPVDKDRALKTLRALRWAVSEVQHHDGITGTESPKVANMYLQHLSAALTEVQELLVDLLLTLHHLHAADARQGRRQDDPEPSEQHVLVFNPLAWNITTIISVAVEHLVAAVLDDDGQTVPSQTQRSAESNVTFDLFFVADLGGLQQRRYIVQFSASRCRHESTSCTPQAQGVEFQRQEVSERNPRGRRLVPVVNDCYELMLDQDSNLLHSITHLPEGRRVEVTQEFWEYEANGDVREGPISDNYVFSADASAVRAFQAVEMKVYFGKIVSEVRQYFYRQKGDKDPSFSVVTRVPSFCSSEEACRRLEQKYSVGPLEVNTEVVLLTSTSLDNNRTLHTDDNGYQMMKRTHRKFTNNTIARNYYPMTRAAYIEDHLSRMVLVSDRAHGVSSQADGQLELMLHRRLWNNQPWNLGYNLTLNDSSVVRPTLWLMLGSKSSASRHMVEMQHRPVVVKVHTKMKKKTSLMKSLVLPPNLHLLSLSVPGWNFSSDHQDHLKNLHSDPDPDYDRVLLRIMHVFEEGEDPELSKSVTIDLKEVLAGLGDVRRVEERSLTGTWDAASLQRWKWKTAENPGGNTEQQREKNEDPTSIVTISAKQIRTFFVYFNS